MPKRKSIRRRSQKTLRRKRKKARKYKQSKWKLKYPQFKEINYYPYIVRKNEKTHNN